MRAQGLGLGSKGSFTPSHVLQLGKGFIRFSGLLGPRGLDMALQGLAQQLKGLRGVKVSRGLITRADAMRWLRLYAASCENTNARPTQQQTHTHTHTHPRARARAQVGHVLQSTIRQLHDWGKHTKA